MSTISSEDLQLLCLKHLTETLYKEHYSKHK